MRKVWTISQISPQNTFFSYSRRYQFSYILYDFILYQRWWGGRICTSEYSGLSYALREAIPIMELIKEMDEHEFIGKDGTPKVY